MQTDSHLRVSRDLFCLFDSGNKAKLHKERCYGPHVTLASGIHASQGGTSQCTVEIRAPLSLLPEPLSVSMAPRQGRMGSVAQQDGFTSRWNGNTGTFSILRGETTLHQLV